MELKVLGSGNAFNQQARLNSSYLIKASVGNILIDCGFTVPFALQQNKIEFSDIDYILITHYHGDHYAGLAAVLLGLKYVSKREKPLTIIGPGDVKSKTFELLKVLYPGTEKLVDELPLEFISVDNEGEEVDLGDFKVEVFQMIHSDAADPVAYLLNIEGLKLGFSGDTCWHDGIVEFLVKSDKVILECNFAEKVGEGHISIEELEDSLAVQEMKPNIHLTHLYEGSASKAKELGYNLLSDGDLLNFKA